MFRSKNENVKMQRQSFYNLKGSESLEIMRIALLESAAQGNFPVFLQILKQHSNEFLCESVDKDNRNCLHLASNGFIILTCRFGKIASNTSAVLKF